MSEESFRRFKLDLQFFADGDKTEPATPKHLEDARNEGRVARSVELSNGLTLLVAFLSIKLFGSFTAGIFTGSFETFYNMFPDLLKNDFTPQTSARIFGRGLIDVLIGVIPYLLALFVIAFVQNVLQFPGHIACSSKSRSEIVVPVFKDDEVIAVIDVDSKGYSAFDEIDKDWLEKIAKLISPLFE